MIMHINDIFNNFVPINANSKNKMPNNRKKRLKTSATFRAKPIVGQFLLVCNGLIIQ